MKDKKVSVSKKDNSVNLSNNEVDVPDSQLDNNSSGQVESIMPSDDNNIVIESINKIRKLYDNTSLLETVHQYDDLIDKISAQKRTLDSLCDDAIKANELYDKFKRDFGQVVEDSNCGEKLYYAMPIYEDFEEGDEWISRWFQVLQEAAGEDNRVGIRVFVNKNFNNNILSLPKDVYCFKPKSEELKNLTPDVKEGVFLLFARMYSFFKLIKDFSDSLRMVLLKSLSLKNSYQIKDAKKTFLPTLEQLREDEECFRKRIDSIDFDCSEISAKYQGLLEGATHIMPKVLNNPDEFIIYARNLYQNYQNYQNEIESLRKQIYTKSLAEIYKLFDAVNKSLSDFESMKANTNEAEEDSLLCCKLITNVLENMLQTIRAFLKDAYSIVPLKIEVGSNFNNYDIFWYEVLVAEDAPSTDLIECISSISDSGFAKMNLDGNIEFVTRTANIAVYGNKVANSSGVN